MDVSPPSTVELERVLDVLLHDVRGPLGVVGGYLRLLRERQLTDPEKVERAIGKAQDALRSVADVCAEAAQWLPKTAAATTGTEIAVPALVAALATAPNPLPVSTADIDDATRVHLAHPLARVADAITRLMRLTDPRPDASIALHRDGRTLTIATGSTRVAGEAQPFDPWQVPGLSAALACHVVAVAGGRCISDASAPRRLEIRFDVIA